ncbi:hypothetical protein [Marinoscillum sp. MHG1-6]|uniref:hypothetical protein n=1 Tax=Marinoscillum sp. MHG1-6 TaxID=2959627 RepID=UPI0021587857|nr:hypothetical protein [Marinoscillum sp. MHG1-6]
MSPSWKGLMVLVLMVEVNVLAAQDLENINETKILDYSGGISASTTAYEAWGIENRRDPFFWQISANLNFTILGIVEAPFSMTFSQQNKDFSQPQPFNRFGISPTYKALTMHLGHRSMNFSSYTLAGNLFFGAGVEYEPENSPIRVSAVYGRFAKPVRRSRHEGLIFSDPTFRRVGYGAKVGFSQNNQDMHFIMFKAADRASSVPSFDTLSIRPEENLVLGLISSFRFFNRLTWSTDYAHSMYSSDASGPEAFIDKYTFVNNLGGLFTPTISSRYSNAITTSLNYQAEGFQISGKYRRVDPGYTTLGSSFLNNDLEDISGGITFPLFSRKVTIGGSAGVQRNNLNNQQSADIRRFVFSSSVTWMANDRLQLMANYGNYNSSTTQAQIQADITEEELEYYQVSRNGTLNVNYSFGKSKYPYQVSWMGSVQDATDSDSNSSTFISNTLGIQKQIQTWSTNFSTTVNKNRTGEFESLSTGPALGVNRSFQKGKYRTGFTYNLLNVFNDGALASRVSNIRLNGNMKIGEKQGLSLSAFFVTKHLIAESEDKDIKEMRVSLRYNYQL